MDVVREDAHLDGGGDVVVQHAVDAFGHGHGHAELLVDLVDALGGGIPFGDHVHFDEGGEHAVAAADHRAEAPVAAVGGIRGDDEVAHVGRGVHVPGGFVDRVEEPAGLLHCIGHHHGDEVVAEAEAVGDAGGDGVDVLEHGGELDAEEVVGGFGAQPRIADPVGHRSASGTSGQASVR